MCVCVRTNLCVHHSWFRIVNWRPTSNLILSRINYSVHKVKKILSMLMIKIVTIEAMRACSCNISNGQCGLSLSLTHTHTYNFAFTILSHQHTQTSKHISYGRLIDTYTVPILIGIIIFFDDILYNHNKLV